MSDLEKIIRENRNDFDKHIPNPKNWEAINNQLFTNDKAIRKKWNTTYLKIAASFLIFVSASILITKSWHKKYDNIFYTIKLPTPEGEIRELKHVIENNELTLVQFWSSWSKVCSDYNCYYFVPAYNKFKHQGFEIYAVSLDENKQEWIKKIEEDELSWINVSDLKGFDSPICKTCDVKNVPANFLLNKDGDIIAKNLNADSLDQTLTTLFALNRQ